MATSESVLFSTHKRVVPTSSQSPNVNENVCKDENVKSVSLASFSQEVVVEKTTSSTISTILNKADDCLTKRASAKKQPMLSASSEVAAKPPSLSSATTTTAASSSSSSSFSSSSTSFRVTKSHSLSSSVSLLPPALETPTLCRSVTMPNTSLTAASTLPSRSSTSASETSSLNCGDTCHIPTHKQQQQQQRERRRRRRGMSRVNLNGVVPALLVVDVQNDFLPLGSLAVTGSEVVVDRVNTLRKALHKHGLLDCVVFSQDFHPPGHVSFASSHQGKEPFTAIYTVSQRHRLSSSSSSSSSSSCSSTTTTTSTFHPNGSSDTANVTSISKKTTKTTSDIMQTTVMCVASGDAATRAAEAAGTETVAAAVQAMVQQMLWPQHCVQYTHGAALHSSLDVRLEDYVIRKGRQQDVDSYSAFFDNEHVAATELGPLLKARGVTDVIVVGLAFDYCVGYTALDAVSLGFRTHVVTDATAAVAAESRNEMTQRLEAAGVRLCTASEMVNELTAIKLAVKGPEERRQQQQQQGKEGGSASGRQSSPANEGKSPRARTSAHSLSSQLPLSLSLNSIHDAQAHAHAHSHNHTGEGVAFDHATVRAILAVSAPTQPSTTSSSVTCSFYSSQSSLASLELTGLGGRVVLDSEEEGEDGEEEEDAVEEPTVEHALT